MKALGTEEAVLKRLEGNLFQAVEGGHQMKTVYLSDDLVVAEPIRRAPIYWNEEKVRWIEGRLLLAPFYKWARERNALPMVHLKQWIKLAVACLSGDPDAGSLALQTTLRGYRLAKRLDDLADPSMVLDSVTIQTGKQRRLTLSPAIVRERCDETLLDRLEALIRAGQRGEAWERIEEVLQLDQEIWRRQLCNIDPGLKNYRIRKGKVVLRDMGHLSDRYDEVLFTVASFHGLHGGVRQEQNALQRNIARLAACDRDFSERYRRRALREVYTVPCLNARWFQGREEARRDGS